jgi:hypothetical protein
MNAAGGGTNKPQMISGVPHAAGGGLIGKIKDFIRYKIGYDVERPETWGVSFLSGIYGRKTNNNNQRTSRSNSNAGADNNSGSFGQGLLNQGQGLVNRASYDVPKQAQGLLNQGQGLVNKYAPKPSQLNPLNSLGSVISKFADNQYFGENAAIERERRLGLMKPGADSLTVETRNKLKSHDEYVRSLYNSEKDKGIVGVIKKTRQEIENKGIIPDLAASLGLKEEGTEKFIEKISGGKIKNFGASVTGVQASLKSLAGPLGRMFRIDDRGSLGRYLRPAMLEAQKQGHGKVGAKALTQEVYDKLLPNRMANFALGQTSFTVDKSGRAKTEDVWDFNQTAQANFGQSRQALKAFGNILQGKEATIGEGKNLKKLTGISGAGKALYEAGFKGMSGIYRSLQNTSYGNLRPMGNDIDLGGGFKPTDENGRVIKKTPQQLKMEREANQKEKNRIRNQQALESKRPWWDKMGLFGGASAQMKKERMDPQSVGKQGPTIARKTTPPPIKPPTKPKVTVIKAGQGGKNSGTSKASGGTPKAPSFSANHGKTNTAAKTLGVNRK